MGLEHAAYIRNNHPEVFAGRILHLSCEVGARKPTKLYFQSFLMQHPEFADSVFVDDREENLEMAKQMGFEPHQFSLENLAQMSEDDRKEAIKDIRSKIFTNDFQRGYHKR